MSKPKKRVEYAREYFIQNPYPKQKNWVIGGSRFQTLKQAKALRLVCGNQYRIIKITTIEEVITP